MDHQLVSVMPDQPSKPNRDLSDISHLFLSSIRQRQTNGAPLPQRKPPRPRKELSVDLSPEELAAVQGPPEAPAAMPMRLPQVTAVIASHLGSRQIENARRYARHLASTGRRVGLIEVETSELRVVTFDLEAGDAPEPQAEIFDARSVNEAFNELSCDLDCWLLLASNPRLPESRGLMREAGRWVLLSTCDHDGVVSAYRTLKGLSEASRPRLSLAVLESRTPAQAQQIHAKLSSVCSEFLGWPVEPGDMVKDAPEVQEHLVMCSHLEQDGPAAMMHFQVTAEFVARARALSAESQAPAPMVEELDQRRTQLHATIGQDELDEAREMHTVEPDISEPERAVGVSPLVPPADESSSLPEIVDLPPGQASDAILGAVLQRSMSELAECPVRPPMCPQARIAVGRDRRLVLLAVEGAGLKELRSIGQSLAWLSENRQLVAMALPQFAIDTAQSPHLRLMVDQVDADAQILGPMLAAGTVSIQTYRRVRWNGKMGLLLDAA